MCGIWGILSLDTIKYDIAMLYNNFIKLNQEVLIDLYLLPIQIILLGFID